MYEIHWFAWEWGGFHLQMEYEDLKFGCEKPRAYEYGKMEWLRIELNNTHNHFGFFFFWNCSNNHRIHTSTYKLTPCNCSLFFRFSASFKYNIWHNFKIQTIEMQLIFHTSFCVSQPSTTTICRIALKKTPNKFV